MIRESGRCIKNEWPVQVVWSRTSRMAGVNESGDDVDKNGKTILREMYH